MKKLLKLILFITLISNSACSQNSSNVMHGKWTLEMSNDGDWYPDIIIFKSDNKYLVYNDMDFVGMPNITTEYDIITDIQTATALTETGNWIYNSSANQIILSERNFIKEKSLFNDYYGKGETLVFEVKNITDKKVILCSKGNKCDTYIKNYNPRDASNITFYRELKEEYTGTNNQTQEILLSGYETELNLSYEFFKESDELIIEDRSGKVLFSTEMVTTDEVQTVEIDLRGVTQLIFKINCSKPESKWKYSVDIK